jgi:hypothetical protein
MNLQLIVSNEWTLLPLVKTAGFEVFHKEYTSAIHGIVFVDENGKGNASIMTDEDDCLAIHETEVKCFDTLKATCDRLYKELNMGQAGVI